MGTSIDMLFLSMTGIMKVGQSFEEAVSVVVTSLREREAKRVENPPNLVVTGTGRLLQPILNSQWVKSGALVLPVHTFGWDPGIVANMDQPLPMLERA